MLFPESSANEKVLERESASEAQTGNARARLTMATHAHLDPPARVAWRGPVNARRARRGDPTGRPRRAPRVAGPDVHANKDRTLLRRGARLVPSASADDGRDDAAEAARLAPLEASTAMGSELERILKTDPVAFDRALSDQVGSAPSLPPPAAIPTHSRSLRFFGRPISDSPSPPPLRSVGCGAPRGPTR